MARKLEIEYKFLVLPERLPELPPGRQLRQAYLSFKPAVRVRLDEPPAGSPPRDDPARGYLTIKGDGLVGRDEFEYEIPVEDASALLELAASASVTKSRHRLPAAGAPDLAWEIDVFTGRNAGLVVAELEVPDPDFAFERPDWLGADVTQDPRYKNAELARNPFSNWLASDG